jgi:glyoxylate/hydroxypyruvate reductase A
MTLLLAIKGAGANWSPQAWAERFARRMPERAIAIWPNAEVNADDVHYVAAWKPEPGSLGRFPNLKVIFNLGAGVDALLEDKALPDVPIVRVVSPNLTKRMTEYVVLHTLWHHRHMTRLLAAQAERRWDAPDQAAASDVRVGIMGLGEIARDAAEVLKRIGFQVAGWSRSGRPVADITTFGGENGLKTFLGRTDILVALLPLTQETRGILNRKLFSGLARDGVGGGPILINAGRGGLQVEADIVASLDDGMLAGATLDVFEVEPLPGSSPLWRHPRVVITPHNAADSDPDAISEDVVRQIKAFERGEALHDLINRSRGY